MANAFLDRVSNKALGQLLVEKGALTPEQVDQALELSREQGTRLGEALVSLGFLSRDALGYAIGEQYGLRPMELQPSMIDRYLISRFDFDMLNAHTMLPLILVASELIVVVSDPNDQEGLLMLSREYPEYNITPQLGAADQIRRCLEAVRPINTHSDFSSPEGSAPNELRQFEEIPSVDSADFMEWLIGMAASQPGRDVLIRDVDQVLQVSLTPAMGNDSEAALALTELGRWPGHSVNEIRQAMVQFITPLEHTRGQAGYWNYKATWNGKLYQFLVLLPIIQDRVIVRIRAMIHPDGKSDDGLLTVPLSPALEAGKYTVVLYDETVSLERSLSYFIKSHCSEHSILVSQQATRSIFADAVGYPAPFTNMVTAVQATAATCVIYDHPVEYCEAIRLLTSTYPPPAVLVCAPLPSHEGGSGSLSPDIEELISRQGAQSVRLMDSVEPKPQNSLPGGEQ